MIQRFVAGHKYVLFVTKPIPGFNALPGDELLITPADPDFPVTLRRTFDYEMLSAVPHEDGVDLMYELPDDVTPPELLADNGVAMPVLKLVREDEGPAQKGRGA